jgi:ubiquinone/menaquinone biosynthesis C-methylase UbiE
MSQAKRQVQAKLTQSKGKRRRKNDLDQGELLPSQRLKRPPGAYFLFFAEFREQKKNVELACCDMAKACGAKWTAMSDREKARFKTQAAKLKAKYDKEKKALASEDKEFLKKQNKERKCQMKGKEQELVMQAYEDLKQKQEAAQEELERTTTTRRKRSRGEPASKKRKEVEKSAGEMSRSVEESEALLLGETEYLLRFPSHDLKPFKCSLCPDRMDGTDDMIDTMKCLAMDYPACQLAADNATEAVEASDYEALGKACELFNASLLFVKPKAGEIKALPPNKYQTDHILNQAYTHVVKDSNSLNKYKGFSDQVYGEAGHELISELIRKVPITKNDVFLDLGSGIGQVVMQVAAQAQCKTAHGIEFSDIPASYAEEMDKEFQKLMAQYSKAHGSYQLYRGSFLDHDVLSDELLASVDVIFCNNVAFSTETNQNLLERFKVLKEGAKIISMRSFEAFQAGGRGRNRTSNHKFKFWCPCGTMGVNESHVRELRLVNCMQCGTYAHRKCNGIKTEEQANGFLCKSCVRYMSKQVETSAAAGICMDVLGPFYPESENTVSWTSSRVGYFIHTIKGRKMPLQRRPTQAATGSLEVHIEACPEQSLPLRTSPRNKENKDSSSPAHTSAKKARSEECAAAESGEKMEASPGSEADSDATIDDLRPDKVAKVAVHVTSNA